MFRKLAFVVTASLVGAAMLDLASLAGAGRAEAYEARWERRHERTADGWRPAPPLVHGYWGARYWRRLGDGERRQVRPPHHQGYDHGWR